jgi:glutaredoxin
MAMTQTNRRAVFFMALAGVVALGLGSSSAYAGKAYKWVDEQGKVHYQDNPPPESASQVEERDIRLGQPVPPPAGSPEAAAANAPVTLYVIPGCDNCDLARSYLQERQVPFTEKNVEQDKDAQAELKKRIGTLAVPTIVVGEKVMRGYIRSLLSGELDAAGYPPAPRAEGQGGAETEQAGTAQGGT